MTDQEREDRELARLQAEIDWLFDAPVSRPVTSLSTARNAGKARTSDYWHGHKYYVHVVRPRLLAERARAEARKKAA